METQSRISTKHLIFPRISYVFDENNDLPNFVDICQVHQNSLKKSSPEIPTPQFSVADTYERDYSRTFTQPPSYLRGRGGL